MAEFLKVHVAPKAGGPLADGDAAKAIGKWEREVVKELAKRALKTLKAWPMNESGRSTGAFARNVKVSRRGNYARIPGPRIRGQVWAPWLEGVTDRNESTGFGGYHLFRITSERMDDIAPEVGEEVLAKILPELGGE